MHRNMNEITSVNVENRIDSEIAAAIAMALERYNAEEHDAESFTLTIHHEDTTWNSRTRTVRHLPRRK